jgi:hypothetical protein
MLLYKPIKVKGIYLLLLFTMLLFSSCVFTNKENSKLKEANETEIEEQQIAQFLVKITELNIKIIKLIEVSKNQEISNDYELFFKKLEKTTYEIQKQVVKISEEKLVNLPIYNKPINYKISEESLIEQIMNELIAEVVQFDKVKGTINDASILNLKNNYLPELNSNLEIISTLKVKKYTNN